MRFLPCIQWKGLGDLFIWFAKRKAIVFVETIAYIAFFLYNWGKLESVDQRI
jgi:hypothetical protein